MTDPKQEQGIFEPPGPPTHCLICGTRFHKGRCQFRNKPDHKEQEYKPLSEAQIDRWEQRIQGGERGHYTSMHIAAFIATIRDLQGQVLAYEGTYQHKCQEQLKVALEAIERLKGQVSLRDERLQAIVKAWEEQDVGDYDTWLFAVADEVNTAMRFLEPKEG